MRAREQTDRMLAWFEEVGVSLYDLAVRRRDGTFIREHSRGLDRQSLERCLAWARFENTAGADVYVRPARGHPWPVVFLDDVSPACGRTIAGRYGSLVVRTSGVEQGGCHVWLRASQALDGVGHRQVQRWLAHRAAADPASTSGEHWGRLAGMKNHKRGGVWVTVVDGSRGPAWDLPRMDLGVRAEPSGPVVADPDSKLGQPASQDRPRRDESVAEFAWCCHELRRATPPDRIEAALTHRASRRGKRNPES